MRGLSAALVGACLAAPAALAQAPAAPSQAPAAPNQAPAAPPAEGAGPQLDRNQALAAKLAGLVGFVNVSCPELRGEPELLHAAVRRLGIEPEALNTGALHFAAASYLESYRKDVPANCQRALDTFGPTSSLVPNLVVRR
jgi:hypothetical protein